MGEPWCWDAETIGRHSVTQVRKIAMHPRDDKGNVVHEPRAWKAPPTEREQFWWLGKVRRWPEDLIRAEWAKHLERLRQQAEQGR